MSTPTTITFRNVRFTYEPPVELNAEMMATVRAAVANDGPGFRAFLFAVFPAKAGMYTAIRQFRVPAFTAENAMDFARFIHTKYRRANAVECRLIAE